MYNKSVASISELNAFYAIKSYGQKDLISQMDTLSFGWGEISYDETLDQVNLQVSKPDGYEEAVLLAKEGGSQTKLSIYASNTSLIKNKTEKTITYLLLDPERRSSFIEQMISELESSDDFDGVVIDFEDMQSSDLKPLFNIFLSELDTELEAIGKTLTVMVQPSEYYSGYDFKTIGQLADRVILMAHDYNARSLTAEEMARGYSYTPLTPIKQVFSALEAITDEDEGVQDTSKLSLQISFATAQWGINAEGAITNQSPYTPDYSKVYERLLKEDTSITYDTNSQNPKASYYNASDGLTYVIWYEDARSVQAKIELGKLFDIHNISIWRLGNIPDYNENQGKAFYMNVMSEILAQ
jgi:spore germination protein YaaH